MGSASPPPRVHAVAQGVPYAPDLGTVYLGHADIDLESVIAEPAVQVLLRRRD